MAEPDTTTNLSGIKQPASLAPLMVWRPGDRKTGLLGAILMTVALLYWISVIDVDRKFFVGDPFGDFFAIWSWARTALSHPLADLYNTRTLHQAQVALGMPAHSEYPYAYPPTFLLFIGPLGDLPYKAAYLVWIFLTFSLFLVSLCWRQTHGKACVYAAVLAPACGICFAVGQSGFLLAALLVGGVRLLPRHKLVAGVLFGLISYKPQFGVLLPIALIAAGEWLSIIATAGTIVVLVASTSAVFGFAAWIEWLHVLPTYGSTVYASPDFRLVVSKMPTILANLRTMGMAPTIARDTQALGAAVAALVVWFAWRHGPSRVAAAILFAGMFLATPYAFIYDLPVLAAGVILFAVDRIETTGFWTPAEIAVMILVLIIPIIANLPQFHPPVGAIPIALFLMLLLVTGPGFSRRALL